MIVRAGNTHNMENIFEKYLQSVSAKFSHKETSEMGYRTDFEILLKEIFEAINVRRIDHDARAQEGNKPDFIVMKNSVPILYLEAKDIGVPLDKVEKSEQMARYYGYANLVLTDYVEFRFYRNGQRYEEPIKIADFDIKNRTLTVIPDNYEHLAKTLVDFTQSHKEPIKSGEHLAKIMGGKAQRIRDNIRHKLANPSDKNTEIMRVYETIKKLLVHDLNHDTFADMYAQTLVYGLFVARFHDETPETFSRREAVELVPKSNPLLRHFFDHIVGADFDKRLEYIVNELCEVFLHANVQVLMKQYFKNDLWGGTEEGPDPVIHFYEDFLKEYDPELRKRMGAFYTPLPVVRFIVRSVDHLLEKEFGLPAGLADTSKLSNGMHRVQILDPAAGTGTFLAEVLHNIKTRFTGQAGRWPTYVHHDLLPRLHGFELMMAPYTIAHLKLGMVLKETGFKYFNNTRLGVYLTNSLEVSTKQSSLFDGFGFAESIAEESRQASIIKDKTPIMVVVGNPPYSVSSSNKGEWIQNLIKDYKTELNERNIQPLSDDYIKFIRFAENLIEKNNSGLVAMITNNSFLDGIIHRQMRKHLLQTFNDIYVFDLHGNSKKKEKAPDGGKDENVFDIQQGVAISIFVRTTEKKKGLGVVWHAELYGERECKFSELNINDIRDVKWNKLDYIEPHYFFVPKEFELKDKYAKGFKIDDLCPINTSGIKTHHDNELVSFDKLESDFNVPYLYRPFDYRYIDYNLKKVERHRYEVMKHTLNHKNISLITSKQFGGGKRFILSCSNILHDISSQPFAAYYNFPLYLYADDGSRAPNLKKEIIADMEKTVGKVTPEDIFDYIYAVLHSPSYREKYKEFLKIDFPRVPYPKDAKTFKALVKLGTELRLLHLLESPKVNEFITTYPVTGSNVVEKVSYEDGKVFINKEQYFGKVPEIAWNFYIGGYQPAQKWLKDRKGRVLTNADIEHYQKIIVALAETDRIMKEIDEVGVVEGEA